MFNKHLVDWLQNICRAIFVLDNAPKNAPLTPYARETVRAAIESLVKLKAEIAKVEKMLKLAVE